MSVEHNEAQLKDVTIPLFELSEKCDKLEKQMA